MTLKVSDLLAPMVDAAKTSLAADWPKVKDFAQPEFKKLAQSMVDITKLIVEGKVNEQQAKALLQIHKNTTQIVMLTVQGMGLIAVENAINAALKAAAGTVNAVTGFKLL